MANYEAGNQWPCIVPEARLGWLLKWPAEVTVSIESVVGE